ncbi:MAG: DUF4912 domain-containing protein [Elusimicrobia bacterium]|nr:DUF4912 domain-containing protein [Elusimicrobiota bacterium]
MKAEQGGWQGDPTTCLVRSHVGPKISRGLLWQTETGGGMNSQIFHLPLGPLDDSLKTLVQEDSPRVTNWFDSSPDKDRLIALPRDAHWIFVCWEFVPELQEKIQAESKKNNLEAFLELYSAETNQSVLSIPVDASKGRMYLKASVSGKSYYVELKLRSNNGTPFTTLRSNILTLPYGYPADGSEEMTSVPSRFLSLALL